MFNVQQFGAKGDGVTDDSLFIQKAIDSLPHDGGIITIPAGIYRIYTTLTLRKRQTRLIGESYHNTMLIPAMTCVNTISIQASDCEVGNLNIRSLGVGIEVRGAGLANICNNLFLSQNLGTAILFDDRKPDSDEISPGSYVHRVEGNYFGRSGYVFKNCIRTIGSINACKILNNHFLADDPVVWERGGGNTFSGNLFQSLSGNYGSGNGVGTALNLGEEALITGNYFERYEKILREGVPHQFDGNHNDHNICWEPEVTFVEGNMINITRKVHYLNGNGQHRRNCLLSDGLRDGQRVLLIGYTWSVELNPNAAQFGTGGVPTFGNSSGQVQTMELVWLGRTDQLGKGMWYEVSRTVRG